MEEHIDVKAECVCGSTHFMQEDGKTFCMECQTELESAKEIIYESVDYGPDVLGDLTQRSRVLTTTVKKQTVQAKELPTSWECFNQILCDLVDEIEELEDTLFGTTHRDFKLTVLQLWAAYLRYHSKAFFSKESADYPRFNSRFNLVDAEIIYKIKRPPTINSSNRKRNARATNARAKKRNIRTIQRKANQLELSKKKPVAPVETTTPRVPFQFTQQAKQCLKTLMSDEHLKEHEENPLLRCHKYIYKHTLKKTEEITRLKLYVLILLGLNHVESAIQIGDLVRFLREGHVSLQIASAVSNDARYNLDFNNRIQKGCTSVPTHASFRTFAADIAREIDFKFKPVDLSALCHRYVQDLCLPAEIAKLIDIILHICPPTMDHSKVIANNYEGRAMAYILFVLKLLFGLDDSREYTISSSGREINKKISELRSDDGDALQQKQLFIWCDWVEYIEMRHNILVQLHCPTAMKYYAHGDGMTAMYLEYLSKMDEKNADAKSAFKPYAKWMRRVQDQIRATYNINPKLDEKIAFYPSLTPQRSYMEEVRYSDQSDVIVPTFMDVAHDECDIEPFLNPSKLQQFFRQYKIKLDVNRLKCQADIDAPPSTTTSKWVDSELLDHRFANYCSYDFDITTEQWLKELNDQRLNEVQQIPKDEAKKKVEMRLKAIADYNRNAKEKKRIRLKNEALEMSGSSNDSIGTNSTAYVFDCYSSDEDDEKGDDNYDETLEFSISNSDYWLILKHGYKHDFPDVKKNLSKTFQWLLKQGAELTEIQEMDLYLELMVIECYFTNDVKPTKSKKSSRSKKSAKSMKSTLGTRFKAKDGYGLASAKH